MNKILMALSVAVLGYWWYLDPLTRQQVSQALGYFVIPGLVFLFWGWRAKAWMDAYDARKAAEAEGNT